MVRHSVNKYVNLLYNDRPDITVMVDWALKINYLSIYLYNERQKLTNSKYSNPFLISWESQRKKYQSLGEKYSVIQRLGGKYSVIFISQATSTSTANCHPFQTSSSLSSSSIPTRQFTIAMFYFVLTTQPEKKSLTLLQTMQVCDLPGVLLAGRVPLCGSFFTGVAVVEDFCSTPFS